MMNPACWPEGYRPSNLPMKPATSAPAIPSNMLTKIPPAVVNSIWAMAVFKDVSNNSLLTCFVLFPHPARDHRARCRPCLLSASSRLSWISFLVAWPSCTITTGICSEAYPLASTQREYLPPARSTIR